ncbi:hypothetical protein FRC03_010354 [Tulasnella sp. 419]|nr:hypothetical protein FRC03_010354 [Tulasnella sp. 419]
MATFANVGFNVANYASFRPTYPLSLYRYILSHHVAGTQGKSTKGIRNGVALDIGCGTGQVTKILPNLGFTNVIGTDPSAKMIDQANNELQTNEKEIRYMISKAEEVDAVLPPHSVDLITAGQAAHWFDHDRLWPALSRVLKPGGLVAFWGYAEFRLPGRPDLTPAIKDFSNGSDKLGPFWEQPGRNILDDHFRAIPFPTSPEWDQASARRVYFGGEHLPELDVPFFEMPEDEVNKPGEEELELIEIPDANEYKTNVILRKKLTWEGLQAYFRTWSSLHSYHEKNPDDKARKGRGKDGDIVERFVESLKDEIGGNEVTIEWPLTLIMIKKTSG